MINIKGRHLLTLLDYSTREIEYLLDLSRDLKRAKYAGTEEKKLNGKNVVILFQKTSTRTRCAFEVAALDQGAVHKWELKNQSLILPECLVVCTMRLNSDVSNKQIVMNLQNMLESQFIMVYQNYITPHKWLPTIWQCAKNSFWCREYWSDLM
jgi:ornithine carbamoyltransferase